MFDCVRHVVNADDDDDDHDHDHDDDDDNHRLVLLLNEFLNRKTGRKKSKFQFEEKII